MIITPLHNMGPPEQVPDEAWKATGLKETAARAVVAAALNAWPNANKAVFAQGPHLILPVPK